MTKPGALRACSLCEGTRVFSESMRLPEAQFWQKAGYEVTQGWARDRRWVARPCRSCRATGHCSWRETFVRIWTVIRLAWPRNWRRGPRGSAAAASSAPAPSTRTVPALAALLLLQGCQVLHDAPRIRALEAERNKYLAASAACEVHKELLEATVAWQVREDRIREVAEPSLAQCCKAYPGRSCGQ